MEKLSASQQAQLKKMSDERLRVKLSAAGHDSEEVFSWEREELVARYAEVVATGGGAKGGVAPADPELERERWAAEQTRLALEEKRMAEEKEEKDRCFQLQQDKLALQRQERADREKREAREAALEEALRSALEVESRHRAYGVIARVLCEAAARFTPLARCA